MILHSTLSAVNALFSEREPRIAFAMHRSTFGCGAAVAPLVDEPGFWITCGRQIANPPYISPLEGEVGLDSAMVLYHP